MNKNLWILNHYAGAMFIDKGGRHYWFAKYLHREGYSPVVFACNTKHGIREQWVETNELWVEKKAEEIETPFVFVKSSLYSSNGIERVKNMILFYKNVKRAAIEYAEKHGKPDIILASSVHPLTLVAGIQIAKKFGVKCICEVRDLWPESIVAYSTRWTRDNLLMRILYQGEKWIYKKADHVIMTWPGGYDYIKEQGWSKDIPESKVTHISNGVDLDSFDENCRLYPTEGTDIDSNLKNFIYMGSIRKVNNVGILVEAAEILKKRNVSGIKILIYGDGDELSDLKNKAEGICLDNLVFMGKVKKQYVPYILKKSYATILHNSSTELDKYGQSQNKFFEYLAAGKPILMTYRVGHSVIKDKNCGIELDNQSPDQIAKAIEKFASLNIDQYREYCSNTEVCSKEYDFKEITNKLIEIIKIYMK